MGSRKKETTGISLLSMYNDEEEDMEDAESESDEREPDNEEGIFDNVDSAIREEEGGLMNVIDKEGVTESDRTPRQLGINVEQKNDKKASLSFVDYGHDEVAMSPEVAEEGEINAAGQDNRDLELLDENGDGQQKDETEDTDGISTVSPFQTQTSNIPSKGEDISESIGVEGRDDKTHVDVDPLDLFLPPPPVEKCSQELQDKINKFLALKRSGKSFNKEVRNKKAYRNPDFLLHAVTYQEIDQIGSCFGKDVFDPHGYDKSDYYDEIEADMKRELERKRNQKLDFVVGGVQPGVVPTALKPTLPSPDTVPNQAVSGPSSLDAVSREGRQNKKSKWDKIDGDQGSHIAGGHDSKTAVVGTHGNINAAASAGYTAFAQQRRKEAEERKSNERRRSRS